MTKGREIRSTAALLPVASMTTYVLDRERLPEPDEAVVKKIDPLLPLDLPVMQERRLRERAMNVHADDRHDSSISSREPAGLHDIYGFALAAQPGRS